MSGLCREWRSTISIRVAGGDSDPDCATSRRQRMRRTNVHFTKAVSKRLECEGAIQECYPDYLGQFLHGPIWSAGRWLRQALWDEPIALMSDMQTSYMANRARAPLKKSSHSPWTMDMKPDRFIALSAAPHDSAHSRQHRSRIQPHLNDRSTAVVRMPYSLAPGAIDILRVAVHGERH